jgi:hypothetical protein
MAIAKVDVWQGVHYLRLWCPGCQCAHQVVTSRDPGAAPGIVWEWDGSLDAPTLSPSLLVRGHQWPQDDPFHKPNHRVTPGQPTCCHSFVRAGVWEYLSDCTHTLAGQHVPVPEWDDDWLGA